MFSESAYSSLDGLLADRQEKLFFLMVVVVDSCLSDPEPFGDHVERRSGIPNLSERRGRRGDDVTTPRGVNGLIPHTRHVRSCPSGARRDFGGGYGELPGMHDGGSNPLWALGVACDAGCKTLARLTMRIAAEHGPPDIRPQYTTVIAAGARPGPICR